MDPSKLYSQRAAIRLGKILDEEGYPFDLVGRSNALASSLGIAAQEAIKLLSGITHWDFADLLLVCNYFEKDAGYFLDKNYNGAIPSDAKVVTSLDGNEAIVWRAPQGFIKNLELNPDTVLRYITAPQDLVSGFQPGSLLVCASHPKAPLSLSIGSFYVIQTADGFEVMKCIEIQEEISRFEFLNDRIGALAVRFPNDYEGPEKRALVVGSIIASIQSV